MAIITISKISELNKHHRLDPEFYQPENLIDFSNKKWTPIKKHLKKCQYGISQAMHEESIGYPIFRMDDIVNCFLENEGVKFIELPEKQFKQFKLEKNDVLFNRVNAEQFVGRTGIFKLEGNFVCASYLIRMQVSSSAKITPDYLNLFLNTKYGLKQIRRFRRRAVNQANVNAQELKNFNIFEAPKKIQKDVSVMSDLIWKKKIEVLSVYNEAKKIFYNALDLDTFQIKYKKYFTESLSKSFTNNRLDAEYVQPLYDQLQNFMKKKCEVVSLKKLMTGHVKGIEIGSSNYEEDGKKFLRVSNITKEGFLEKDQKFLSSDLYNKLKKKYKPQIGDFLLTKDANPGIAYVVKENVEGILSGGILRLKMITKEIDKEYLAFCINSIIGMMQVEQEGAGSVILHWRPSRIKELQVPVLSEDYQNKIKSLVIKSHQLKQEAEGLLKQAKKKVEDSIDSEIK